MARRVHAELRDRGWRVSENTVAKSMASQGLVARAKKRRMSLTRQDKTKSRFRIWSNATSPRPHPTSRGSAT